MVGIKISKVYNLKYLIYEYFFYYILKYEFMYFLLFWKYDIKWYCIINCIFVW